MRPVWILACAILSFLAGLLVFGRMGPPPSRPEERPPTVNVEGQPPTVNVLVAVTELEQGFVLSDPVDLFDLRKLPADNVPANALTASNSRELLQRHQELKGKQLARTLKVGTAITSNDLLSIQETRPQESDGSLYRGVSFRAKLGDFGDKPPGPGDRVDLIYTGFDPESPEKGVVVKVVLKNVLLVSICEIRLKEPEKAPNHHAAVTQKQAESMLWIHTYNIPPDLLEIVPPGTVNTPD